MTTDLYVGYMDEEVASLLLAMMRMKEAQSTEFRVFERGFVPEDTKLLFERPLSQFPEERKVSFRYHDMPQLFTSKAPDAVSYQEYLRRRLWGRTNFDQEVKLFSSVITEITFGPASDEEPDHTTYLIRAPEMGKQPGIVRLYLRLLIRYLKKARKIDRMNVGCFGTGGGIVPGERPGALQKILASAFVGPDVDPEGRQFPNVDFIYWSDDGKDLYRKSSLALSGNGPLEQRAEEIFYGDRMPLLIRQVFKDHLYLQDHVSGTFSYFDGSDTKRAIDATYNNLVLWRSRMEYQPRDEDSWRKHPIETLAPAPQKNDVRKHERVGRDFFVNSNMEDYHVLRVLHSMLSDTAEKRNYPQLHRARLLRVAANVVAPATIEHAVKEYVGGSLFSVKLEPAEYKQLVVWGEHGVPMIEEAIKGLPRVATKWHETLGLDESQLADLLVFHFVDGLPMLGYSKDHESYCLEPYCVEIATDYLRAHKNKERESKYSSLPTERSRLWLRGGNKWIGIADSMFLPRRGSSQAGTIQATLQQPKNLDRALYKSSGAPALQVQAENAARNLYEFFRNG